MESEYLSIFIKHCEAIINCQNPTDEVHTAPELKNDLFITCNIMAGCSEQ